MNLDGGENGERRRAQPEPEAVEAHLENGGGRSITTAEQKVLDVEDGVCVLEFFGAVRAAQSIASGHQGQISLVKECKIKQV